jgi:uncharacterized protein
MAFSIPSDSILVQAHAAHNPHPGTVRSLSPLLPMHDIRDVKNPIFAFPSTAHRAFEPRPFHPARWLVGPHLQTLMGKALRPRRGVWIERRRLDTPDGDFLDLDFGPDPGKDTPVVLLLHGLEGSTARRYMRVAMSEISRLGMLAVGLNFRSCSGSPNRLARFYHSGDTGDVSFVLMRLREWFPGRRTGALGFSLGGNVLLRLLGESGDSTSSPLHAAAAISVPFDLREGTRMLETGRLGRVYTRYFLRSLQRKAAAKREILETVLDFPRVMAARTLRDFDDAATAPLHGFPDAWTYYRNASSGPMLPRIRVPTLLLHAFDDPFQPPSAVPHQAVLGNPWITAAFHHTGGHVGFVESGPLGRPGFWAEAEAARYLSHVLGTADPD